MQVTPHLFTRVLGLALCMLLLAGCGAQPMEQPAQEAAAPVVDLPDEYDGESEIELEPWDEYPPIIFSPDNPLTVEETVAAYFEQLYLGYRTMRFTDIDSILWLEEDAVRNSVVWNQLLTQRRRLLYENSLCFVETEEFPYEIEYFDASELRDERLEYWLDRRPMQEGEIAVHLEIKGEPGAVYPPFMPTNAQHTIRLKEFDGVWKITLHYFPGSVRKFVRAGMLELPSEEDMLMDLQREFSPTDSGYPEDPPAGAVAYDPDAAAAYAMEYTESPNPDFYHVGDWMGNCANFTSQCLWAGFGETMTDSWYAVSGGTPAWENVKYFWDFIEEGAEMRGQVIEGISEIAVGDMIQISAGPYRSSGGDKANDYSHTLLVVDEGTLLLAQNTPACFIYYSDVVNVRTRMVRPLYLP